MGSLSFVMEQDFQSVRYCKNNFQNRAKKAPKIVVFCGSICCDFVAGISFWCKKALIRGEGFIIGNQHLQYIPRDEQNIGIHWRM